MRFKKEINEILNAQKEINEILDAQIVIDEEIIEILSYLEDEISKLKENKGKGKGKGKK